MHPTEVQTQAGEGMEVAANMPTLPAEGLVPTPLLGQMTQGSRGVLAGTAPTGPLGQVAQASRGALLGISPTMVGGQMGAGSRHVPLVRLKMPG